MEFDHLEGRHLALGGDLGHDLAEGTSASGKASEFPGGLLFASDVDLRHGNSSGSMIVVSVCPSFVRTAILAPLVRR